MNAMLNGHLQNTLHGILNCQCKKNCLLKSLYVDEIYNDCAFITVEPFDGAFNPNDVEGTINRIKRMLLKRNKKIYKTLKVSRLSVTVYDEWTMKDSFVVDFHAHDITSSVN